MMPIAGHSQPASKTSAEVVVGTSYNAQWDGAIDDADLLIVLFNFGSGC